MSRTFNIGDVVVCVNARKAASASPVLKEGGTYRISGFGYCACAQGCGHGVTIQGVARVSHNGAFHPNRFRKIDAADEQFTEQMRAIKPTRKQAKA